MTIWLEWKLWQASAELNNQVFCGCIMEKGLTTYHNNFMQH
jgi:hypothetical protein